MTPVISEVEIQPGGPGYGLQSVGSQLDSAQTLGHAQCHQQLDRDRLPSQRLEGHFTKRPLKHGTAYLYIYMYTHIIICIIYIYIHICGKKTTLSCRFVLKHLQWCLKHPTYAYQVAAHSKPAEVLSSIIVGTTMV